MWLMQSLLQRVYDLCPLGKLKVVYVVEIENT